MSAGDLVLTVLGSATPYPAVDNACSGYLVSHARTRLWLDAGTGTLARLQRHTRLDELDAIWISHLHADHCADLLTAYYGLRYADVRLTAPLPLYGPPGIADRLASFLTNGPVRSPVEAAFEVHELRDGDEAHVGGLTVRAAAVEHGMPAFGARIETGGKALAYSGDTGPCAALTELATGCDLLLCEADGSPSEGPAVHCAPEDAGRTAAAAGVRQLVLTHVSRFLTPEDAVRRAGGHYRGPIAHAAPGRTFVI
ncbi:MBL fold metallo-hydrolase [Nocardia goodfellowii]|uniref:Ribonuclease BN (tRNA processing enzyme) n=1 Tax=Nocardia goodfellowii TaxID=882446 RepID=A0ABS4QDJ0_9NOCA|nr:MBL fold metallo-hydrolase [Nocardia goodfellowii]MBP2189754.1 ribonuclease BN (tRNA processing enzyme) [Nocardia goodfellowii]